MLPFDEILKNWPKWLEKTFLFSLPIWFKWRHFIPIILQIDVDNDVNPRSVAIVNTFSAFLSENGILIKIDTNYICKNEENSYEFQNAEIAPRISNWLLTYFREKIAFFSSLFYFFNFVGEKKLIRVVFQKTLIFFQKKKNKLQNILNL